MQTVTIQLPPEAAEEDAAVRRALAAQTGFAEKRIHAYRIVRRSIDARSRTGVRIVLQVEVFVDAPPTEALPFDPELRDVHNRPHALIVGAGPAGLFAALRLISLGIKPVILERGKDVRARRRDLAALNKEGIVNPDSNYCFGEGGAGTYSDGKLYTRSNKRGNIPRILNLFVHFGADARILVDAHPHIGTNKLPQIISAMREAIISCGGEVHFDTRVTDFLLEKNAVRGVRTADGATHEASQIILATGHSARDIFELLHRKGIHIEAKSFALGVRIEHPQALIDRIQYRCESRSAWLPPASYSLVSQEEGRGVFSFCMCPGGIIAPAATAPGEIVVNGWSPSKRNNPYANSGTVVAVDERDFAKYGFSGPLAGLHFQQMVEQKSFAAGGGGVTAPAQRLTDFVAKKVSSTLPDNSYLPGVSSADMRAVLPQEVSSALRKAILSFDKKMRGYLMNDAMMVATESRTSSPVRIPRDAETLQHSQITGLYPCAEGAGYAGGIVSAAMDGERCAEAIAARILEG